MAGTRVFRFGPLALTTALGTNLLNPPATSGGVNAGTPPCFIALKHLRATNVGPAPAKVSLWLGASGANAAGSEFVWQSATVAAYSSIDWYSPSGARLVAADFLVGGCDTASAITLSGEGDIGIV